MLQPVAASDRITDAIQTHLFEQGFSVTCADLKPQMNTDEHRYSLIVIGLFK
jgi:menaquinone-dependent protoporphyrinogen IX oxidase